jgi:tetratricopeptide (TPR) repeat protein
MTIRTCLEMEVAMDLAKTIFLLLTFSLPLNAQIHVSEVCELHVSVRDSKAKPVQAQLELLGQGTFVRRQATDYLGESTFQKLPSADFRLSVRLRNGHESVQDVSTAGPNCHQLELVRITGAQESVATPTVFIGDLDVPRAAERLYDKGIKDLHRQDWQDAENELEKAVQIHPTFARAYDALGVAANESGHFLRSDEAFRDAINLNRKYPEAYLNFARSLIRQQREAEAQTLLVELLSFDRQDSAGETLLARCLFDEREYADLLDLVRSLHRQHLSHNPTVHEFAAEIYRRRRMVPEYQSERATVAVESAIHP